MGEKGKNLEKISISTEKQFEDFKYLKTNRNNPWDVPLIVWSPANKRWESKFGHQWFEISSQLLNQNVDLVEGE